MERRDFGRRLVRHAGRGAVGGWALYALAAAPAYALSLSDLSNAEQVGGLKAALEQGAIAAVGKLGVPDGFLGNPKVKIPLPGFLEQASSVAHMLGMGAQLDELVVAMNRAAEAAVPEAKSLLVAAAKAMSVTDARSILTGGPTSVTEYFRSKTEKPLFERFLPIVTRTTSRVGLAQKYNALVARLPVKGDARIEQHVTGKTLDGLYTVIGEEEVAIRRDPVGAGSAIVRRVFGAMK